MMAGTATSRVDLGKMKQIKTHLRAQNSVSLLTVIRYGLSKMFPKGIKQINRSYLFMDISKKLDQKEY